jgi:hypothetical protein
LTDNLLTEHHFSRKQILDEIMSTPVRHTGHKHQHTNREEMPRKKANLGDKTVTAHASNEATPSPELDKVYELSDFANQLLAETLLKPSPGSLVHFSQLNPKKEKNREKYFMWTDLTSCEGPPFEGLKTQNIKLMGLDHELCLQGFLKEGEVVFGPCLFDLDVSKADVEKSSYKITVLTSDYFKRLKTAEGALRFVNAEDELIPIFPPPLLFCVQQYIS